MTQLEVWQILKQWEMAHPSWTMAQYITHWKNTYNFLPPPFASDADNLWDLAGDISAEYNPT